MPRWDAIVVGAGPAGSATALHLARAGHTVLLLDKARFPRDKPCSEYLNPGGTRALLRLGSPVRDALHRAGAVRVTGMRIHAPSGAVMLGQHREALALALPRRALDAILIAAAAAAGVTVREGSAVEAVMEERGRITGVIARSPAGQREPIAARVVIGADGLRSVVARRVGRRVATAPRRIAFAAHVADVAEVHDAGEMHIGNGAYAGLGPVGGGVTTIALVVSAAEARRRGRALVTGFVRELDRFPGLRGRVPPTLARAVLVTGPFARWSRRPVVDGALLVGDAADFFDPFTGQGLFAALRGAELAAAALIPALAGERRVTARALGGYRASRRAAFAGKWVLERLIGLGIGWPALADRVVARLARRPALADLLVGACGNQIPARTVLAPATLARMMW